MHSLEEMTAWTAEDAQAAILASLPEGWSFIPKTVSGWAVAQFTDENGKVVWEDHSADVRLLFFNAYGWLHLREHKPRSPAWKLRTKEVDLYRPTQPGQVYPHVPVPDPEDLDPEEVKAVYADPHFRRK